MEEPNPQVAPMVRFFCDTSERGAVADLSEAYLDAFLTLGLSVRIMSGAGTFSFSEPGRWLKHRERFMTQLVAPFVNVVCLGRSNLDVTIPALRDLEGKIVHDRQVDRAPAIGRFYTIGLKNVLITAEVPDDEKYVAAALKYQVIVVPTSELAATWRLVGADPVMVPPASIAVMRRFRDMLHAA